MEGPLKKRGFKLGVMHDRYCVATWEIDQVLGKYLLLRWFKNHKSYVHHPSKPSSSCGVRSLSDWDGRTGFGRHENGLQMETIDGHVVLCAAPTPADKAQWLALSPTNGDETPEKEPVLKQRGSSSANTAAGVESSHRLSMRYLEQGWCSQGGGAGSSSAATRGEFKPSDLPLTTGFDRDVDLDGAESFTTESESGDAAWAEFMTRGARAGAPVSTEDTVERQSEDDDDDDDSDARSAADEEALATASDCSSSSDATAETSPRERTSTSASSAVSTSRAYSRGCAIANDSPSTRAAKLEISDLPLEPVSVKVARLEAKLSGTEFTFAAAGEAARESELSTSSNGSLAPSSLIKQEETVVLSTAQPVSTSTPTVALGTVNEAVSAHVVVVSRRVAHTPETSESSVLPVVAADKSSVSTTSLLLLPPPLSVVRVDESQPLEPSTPTALSPIAFTLKKTAVVAADASDSSADSDNTSTTSANGPLSPPPRVRAYSSAMLNSFDTFSPPPSHPRVRRYSFSSAHPAPGLAPHLLTMSSPLKRPSFVEPHLGYVHSSISIMVPAFSTLLAPPSRQQSLDVQSEEDEDDEDETQRRSGATDRPHFFDTGRKPRTVSSLSLSFSQESDIDEV